MFKKVFSHTLIYGFAPQITLIANFLVLPIITKDLTEIDFGVSGTLTAYTTAISALSTLGLRVILTNSYFKSPNHYKWGWRQIYGFLNLWNIIYAFILGILVYFAVPEVAHENLWLIVLLNTLPFILFGQTGVIGRQYYQLNQKPMPIAIRSLGFGLLTTILNVLFISYYKMGYMGWFWATFISLILSNASYWLPLNTTLGLKPIYNFKWRYLKNSLKVGLPTIPHYYGSYLLNSSDRLVMDQIKVSTGDIGKYNVANTFSVLAEGFSTAVGWAVGPLLNKNYKDQNLTQARDLIFMLQIIFFCVTFIPSIWLKEIFSLLIKNDELSKMYPLGIILLMSINYRPMYFGANSFLFFYEKTQKLWRITFIAGGANVFLNIILIPFFGFEVAAYTTFIAFLYMGYAGFFFKDFKELNGENYRPWFWFIATILLLFLAYFIVEISVLYKILISISGVLIGSLSIIYFNKKINLS